MDDPLAGSEPTLQDGNCQASVKTYGYNLYPIDPLDFGGLISAEIIKAKMKLEDVVQRGICKKQRRKQCKDVNMKALELALEVSSEEARLGPIYLQFPLIIPTLFPT